jgi:hypothetical protein
MISQQRLDDIAELLRGVLVAEAAAEFPRLSQCPSSDSIKFLDYVATLSAPDRGALHRALARLQVGRFFTFIPSVLASTRELAETDPALRRRHAALQSRPFGVGLRYSGLRMTQAMLNDPEAIGMHEQSRARLDFVPRDDPPPHLLPDPDFTRARAAKAPLLRKLIDPALKRLFATEKTKQGGITVHSGVFEGTPVNVGIDYAARGYQMRYTIHVPDETKTIFTRQLTYEQLWSAANGWDYLTEENAERSVALLCDFIARAVRVRNAVFELARRDT